MNVNAINTEYCVTQVSVESWVAGALHWTTGPVYLILPFLPKNSPSGQRIDWGPTPFVKLSRARVVPDSREDSGQKYLNVYFIDLK